MTKLEMGRLTVTSLFEQCNGREDFCCSLWEKFMVYRLFLMFGMEDFTDRDAKKLGIDRMVEFERMAVQSIQGG